MKSDLIIRPLRTLDRGNYMPGKISRARQVGKISVTRVRLDILVTTYTIMTIQGL